MIRRGLIMNGDNSQRSIDIRTATVNDVKAIEVLIQESFAKIGRDHYSIRQIHKAVSELGRIDEKLLSDGTLYVATSGRDIVGCGGWSRRRNLLSHANGINPGGDMMFAHKDAAVLRLFFVRPGYSRQGIATRLFRKCRAEVESNGFLRLEVLASAPGRAAAYSFGFCEESEVQLQFDDGSHFVSHHMTLRI